MTSRTINETTQILDDDSPTPRTIGYCIANPDLKTSTAIVYFYPLGACSDFVISLAPALSSVKTKFICVDRPGCAHTSWETKHTNENAVIHRIHQYAQDVLEVLSHEHIHHVHVLCACIGHAYGMDVCRRLMAFKKTIHLEAITLVAPFVSTACPSSWGVARFGSHMPNLVLNAASGLKSSFFPKSVKYLGPNMMNKIISKEEQDEFGWTQDDLKDASEAALSMNKKTAKCEAIEVQVGVSKVWQERVCDKFAATHQEKGESIPITIHVSMEDKLVSYECIEWIRDRCYPKSKIVVEKQIHSHEVMTFLGGPPHNPYLLFKICEAWGLYSPGDEQDIVKAENTEEGNE